MGRRARVAGLAFLLLAGCGGEKRGAPSGGTGQKALEHEPFFPIRGGFHEGLACDACHADAAAHPRQFDCLGCHKHEQAPTRAIHAGLGACAPGADASAGTCFAYESPACLACHPRGTADAPTDHDRRFPITGEAAHAGVACGGCHANPSDRTDVTCSSGACHASADLTPQHANVGGFAVDSRLCERCHADAQVDRVRDHHDVPLASGDPHFQGACLSCHPQVRGDKPFGADFGSFACTTCHEHDQAPMDEKHRGLEGYVWGPQSCRTCHPSGGKFDGSVEHPAFPLSGSHAAACGTCHVDAADQGVVSCSSGECHAAADVEPLHEHVGGFAMDSQLCERCHADGQVDRLADHEPLLVTEGAPHFESACLSCHPQVRDDKPFGADFRKKDCLSCHAHEKADMDFLHTGIDLYAYTTSACLDCHADGTKDAEFQHPQFPIEIGSSHEEADCLSCHADRTDHASITCSSGACHPAADVEPPHDHVGGFALDSSLCERCHADGQVDRLADHAPFALAQDAPHFESPCLTCHPQVREDKDFGADFQRKDCLSCHEHDRGDMDFLHTGIADYDYQTSSCVDCHPDGKRVTDFEHPKFLVARGGDHDVACATCHADRSDHANVTCSSGECHASADVTPQHGHVGGFAVKSALCLSCHPDASVFDLAKHTPFDIAASGKHSGEACLTCHPQMREDELSFGTDFTVQTCTDASCHPQAGTTTDHTGVAGFAYATADCLDCHPTGAAADAVDHDGKYPIGKGTSHDEPCSGCHTNAADRSVVTCAGSCHTQIDMSAAHTNKVGGYQYTNSLCLKCHPDTPAFRVADHEPFRITASGRHSACLTCHPSLRDDRPFDAADFQVYDCLGAGCHSNESELDREHQGRAGYAFVSTTCTRSGCHPTGQGD